MTSADSIAARLVSARKLVAQLEPGTPEMARAAATLSRLEALEKEAASLTSEVLTTRARAAAASRDAQKRHSLPWIQRDADFDVLVAVEEDINPTTRDEMGEGSNPAAPAV